jgi:hypothetical protein
MIRNIARALPGLSFALLALVAPKLAAQDAVLSQFYGRGVHQYFAGDSDRAIANLTSAIDGGTKDPRAYYFRALAEMRMGQSDQAATDLQKGAALESADINQFYPVGKSLERIQGPTRAVIERYRVVARAEAFDRKRTRDATRYEERRRAEAEVLRNPKFAPVAPPAPSAPPAAELPAEPAAEELFGDDKPAAEEPAAEPSDAMPDETPPASEEEAMPADDAGDPFADEQPQ